MEIDFHVPTTPKPQPPEADPVEAMKTDAGVILKKFLETPVALGFRDPKPEPSAVDQLAQIAPADPEGLPEIPVEISHTRDGKPVPFAKFRVPEIPHPNTPAPKLTIDVADPTKIEPPSKEEIAITQMEVDDPRALLAQQLQSLPNISGSRAASMAMGLDSALYNLNVAAKRELKKARQQAMREAQAKSGGKPKKRRRR